MRKIIQEVERSMAGELRIPTMADIQRIAEESLGVIERDSAKKLDDRMRRVLIHWMSMAMVDVRNTTLAHQKAEILALAQRISDSIHL